MPKNSKMKGKVGELELAALFRMHGFSDAKRGQQFRGSPDSPDVTGLPGHHVECKRTEALRLYPYLKQAQADAGPDDTPVVCYRSNREEWVAITFLDDYLLMVQELEIYRSKNVTT